MTLQAQRSSIAEACGWYKHDCGDDLCWKNKHTQKTGAWFDVLPDYLSDLNASAEAEKGLTDEQRGQMMDALCEIVRRDHNPQAGPMTAIIAAFFANAAQRAEAFLRTLHLWDDTDEHGTKH